MISYFHFLFFMRFFTNPTPIRVFKISRTFFSQNKRFIKLCLNYFRTIFTFFLSYHLRVCQNYLQQNKFYTVYYIDYHCILVCNHNCKQYDLHIFWHFDQNKYYQLKVLKYFQNNQRL